MYKCKECGYLLGSSEPPIWSEVDVKCNSIIVQSFDICINPGCSGYKKESSLLSDILYSLESY